MTKRGARDRAQLVVIAYESGLVRPGWAVGAENSVILSDLDVRVRVAACWGQPSWLACDAEVVVVVGEGSAFRRCGCTDPVTGRQYGSRCPRLAAGGRHGSWYVRLELSAGLDGRRRIRRGGYLSRKAALKVLGRLRNPTSGGSGGVVTVGDWLAHWLVSRNVPAASTVRRYAAHIRLYLTPYRGQVLLAELPAYAEGPAAGLAILDTLAASSRLAGWTQLHVARGALLAQCGRHEAAVAAYRDALALEPAGAVRRHITGQIAALGAAPAPTEET
jgi:hypothetical protein